MIMNAEYCEFGTKPRLEEYDVGFVFLIPLGDNITYVKHMIKTKCKKLIVMTVCETDPVHESYSKLLEFQPIYCPSEFSRQILQKQFGGDWRLLRHYTPPPPLAQPRLKGRPYTFYTIGNILDHRKNILMLLRAFTELNLLDCILVLKATLREGTELEWEIPNVFLITDVISDRDMHKVHDACDCYVNCSFSEGAGMGAVEAAMRNKPVIISDYGGLREYVKTPYVIETSETTVGVDDFLYTETMKWGNPSLESLKTHMRDCYDKRLTTQDHSYTRELNDKVEDFFKNYYDNQPSPSGT